MADALRDKLSRMSVAGARDLDELSAAWKRRSGRSSGPDHYVAGDVCRSLLLKASSMTPRQREENYGGSLVLCGIIEAKGVPPVPIREDGEKTVSQATYLQLDALDETGHSFKAEKAKTRTVLDTVDPKFDECLSTGRKVDIETISAIRLRAVQYNGPFAAETRIGEVTIGMGHIRSIADANTGGYADLWVDLAPIQQPAGEATPSSTPAANASANGASLGKLHVLLLLHYSPPDPSPLAVHIRIVEARSILATGSSQSGGREQREELANPYLRVSTLARRREPMTDPLSGKKVEAITHVKASTVNPVWNEGVTVTDSSIITSSSGGGGTGSSVDAIAAADASLSSLCGGQWPPEIPEQPFPSVNVHVKKHSSVAEAGRSAAFSLAHKMSSLASGAAGALRGGGGGKLTSGMSGSGPSNSSSSSSQNYEGDVSSGGGAGGDWDHTQTRRLAADLSEARYVSLGLWGHKEGAALDAPLGEVLISFSSLFGDEDAVISEHTLRVHKWYRLRPRQGMDPSLEGTLGHVAVDITLLFAEALLPAGWSEAVDDASGETFYHCHTTGRSQWSEPEALVELLRRSTASASGGAAGSSGGAYSAGAASSAFSGAYGSPPSAGGRGVRGSSFTIGSAGGGGSDAIISPRGGGGGGGGDISGSFGSPGSAGAGGSSMLSGSRASLRFDGQPPLAPAVVSPRAPPLSSLTSSSPQQQSPAAPAVLSQPASASVAAPMFSAKAGDEEDHDADADGNEREEDGGDDEAAAAGASAAGAAALMDIAAGGGKAASAAAIPEAFHNPLASLPAGAAATAADREKAFVEGIKSSREEKIKAEAALLERKLAAMTPEERAEYEAEQAREARREQRKDRMLKSSFAAYGSASKASMLARGGGSGSGALRGGRGGRASAAAPKK